MRPTFAYPGWFTKVAEVFRPFLVITVQPRYYRLLVMLLGAIMSPLSTISSPKTAQDGKKVTPQDVMDSPGLTSPHHPGCTVLTLRAVTLLLTTLRSSSLPTKDFQMVSEMAGRVV